MRHIFRTLALSLALTSAVVPLTTGAASASPSPKQFCTAAANLFGTPTFVSHEWPVLSPTNTSNAAIISLIQRINNNSPFVWKTMADNGATKAVRTTLRAINLAANAELTAANAVWYGQFPQSSPKRHADLALIERSGAAVRSLLAPIASTIATSCASFTDQSLYNQFAITLTLHGVEHAFLNGSTPEPATFQAAIASEGHHIVLRDLVMKGYNFSEAKYKVQTITGWINVCTTIPAKAGTVIRIAKC